MIERIESSGNAKLKLITKLHLAKHRRDEQLFVAEGIRLVEMAVDGNWPLKFALINDSLLQNKRGQSLVSALEEKNCPIYSTSDMLYAKVADTVNSQGILLVIGQRLFTWQELLTCPSGNAPLIAVLDGIQDPGNAGTIIRSADALGCTGVICLEGTVDLFSEKTVRSTMGSLFNIPILNHVSYEEFVDACRDNEVNILATALDEHAFRHYSADYNSATAIVFGNEGNGVSKELLNLADKRIYIPMSGKAESLNVASAAAIVLYEAHRQRALL